jgi:hypothetical protein
MLLTPVNALTLLMTCFAANQGPKVWELEGPTPILNISNTEMNFSISKTNLSEFTVDINNWGKI